MYLSQIGCADQLGAVGLDGVLEGELAAFVDDVAQPLVGRRPFVGGGGGRGEPALVDPASVGAQGVEILGRQLEPPAGHQEGSRDPGRGQPQDTFARVERRANAGADVLIAHPSPSPARCPGPVPRRGPCRLANHDPRTRRKPCCKGRDGPKQGKTPEASFRPAGSAQ